MKKEHTISIKVTEKDYEEIKLNAKKAGITISDYVRSRIKINLSETWIKKTDVQKVLSRVATTLDKYEEKNKNLTSEIRKELKVLWQKL